MDIARLSAQVATPAVLGQVAGLLGTSEAAVQKGLGAAVPGVLAGILAVAKRPRTVEALGAALAPASGAAGGLAELLGRDPEAAAATGSGLLATLLGDGGDALAGALGGYAGLPQAGARSLLGLAGSVAIAGLGKEAGEKGLDAVGALSLLERQKDQIARALPADFAKLLGGTGLMSALGGRVEAPRPAAAGDGASRRRRHRHRQARRSGWTRWLIGLVALLVLIWLGMHFLAPGPAPVVESAAAPEAARCPPILWWWAASTSARGCAGRWTASRGASPASPTPRPPRPRCRS